MACSSVGANAARTSKASRRHPSTVVATGQSVGAREAAQSSCYNLPPSGNVQLFLKAVNDMRNYHFPNGLGKDFTKGVFFQNTDNRTLGKIFGPGSRTLARGPLILTTTTRRPSHIPKPWAINRPTPVQIFPQVQ